MKEWTLLSEPHFTKVSRGGDEIIEVLLANRGLKTKKEINEFLNPPSPYLLAPGPLGIDQKELTKAVKRIQKAIKDKEKIIIYGDYDTDGICSTGILWQMLYKSGANVLPHVPQRSEGYGLKSEKLEELQKSGVGLVITVDNGIVANEQVNFANKIGLDVIICDHHQKGKVLPKAYAIVHTIKLAGAGVSWFLASRFGKPGLELVTIGTVSDMMPLIGPNRQIVKFGLEALRKTKMPGLLSLYKVAGIDQAKIGTYEIGFLIGPRINAAGRMADPVEALRLVCTSDAKKADDLATIMDRQNKERQVLTEEMRIHARDLWLSKDDKGKLIFVAHESYEEGVIGLVAGKLVEEFYRPTIVISRGVQYSKASARSISGFNIIEALRLYADLLGAHGGHPMAAGFTIATEKLGELEKRLVELASENIADDQLTPVLKIDLELPCNLFTYDFWQKIADFEPFGIGNPEPVFLTRGMLVNNARLVGATGSHLKLQVSGENGSIDAIGFGLGDRLPQLFPGKKVDLVFNLCADTWNGNKRIQLKLKDLKVADGN
ncbi:MAG: single-stranded-DNA-specific exonuclease RecJ [bacterium]|nr:single-stranded-DNA-specific exonuclease RecJ [bacterium]